MTHLQASLVEARAATIAMKKTLENCMLKSGGIG
jgi:hypothetical protein